MATDWGKILAMKFIKIVLICIVSIFAFVVIIGISTNKHINLWGLEFNANEPKIIAEKTNSDSSNIVKKDTGSVVYKKYDPATTFIITKDKKSVPLKDKAISQKIDSGSSGLQNNATNYGNQAGRDINITNEPTLLESDKKYLLENIQATMKENNTTCIRILLSPESNGGKISKQLDVMLRSAGYTIDGIGTFYGNKRVDGIAYDIEKATNCLKLLVGTF